MSRGLIYEYDGSFEGFLSCVFESFRRKEMPDAIASPEDLQETLYTPRRIETDPELAKRVLRGTEEKISPEAVLLLKKCFLTCEPQKELLMLRFLRLGFHCGPAVTDMMQNPTVSALRRAVRFLDNESHLTQEFLRFSVSNEAMTAEIEPKNFVLPLIAPHFCSRFYWQSFLICDLTHGAALIHRPGEEEIIPMETFQSPPPDGEELKYRALWRLFYRTIANESRYNPQCRRTHMPMHYWKHMTEFLSDSPPEGCARAQAVIK